MPLAPLTVTVALPAGVEAVVLRVKVEVPGGVTGLGEKLQTAPAGNTPQLKVTELAKLPAALMVTV